MTGFGEGEDASLICGQQQFKRRPLRDLPRQISAGALSEARHDSGLRGNQGPRFFQGRLQAGGGSDQRPFGCTRGSVHQRQNTRGHQIPTMHISLRYSHINISLSGEGFQG